jgi:hypothetical protein
VGINDDVSNTSLALGLPVWNGGREEEGGREGEVISTVPEGTIEAVW